MTGKPSAGMMLFDNPARYRISILGRVNQNWSDRLEGMAIVAGVDDDGRHICTLEGELQDQSALVGVITTLYEMHLPLLLLKCLSCPAAGDHEY